MRLSKVNETHKNMVTRWHADVTDFGPTRRRPGRMKVRPASKPAQAVYRPGLGRNASGGKPAKYYKPTYAGVSAGR